MFTAAQLGFSATNNFANLVLLFNGNEGGNANDQPITLNSLGLSIYSASGVRLQTFTSPSLPLSFTAFPGVGNAGFGFALDATQAAQANAWLVTNPLLRVGTSANAINAQGGPETIQLTTITSTGGGTGGEIPEPSTTFLFGSGIALLAGSSLLKRLRRS